MTRPIDPSSFDVLTFDCYGTLIDWEAGLVTALRRALGTAVGDRPDDSLLEEYAATEAALESGPYQPYRQILAASLDVMARNLGVSLSPDQLAGFGGSVREWPAFADSAEALARLARRYGLGVITNCDDDLFDHSSERLGRPFRWVVTAEQVGAYKPALRNFEVALERIGVPRQKVLHVAQSLYHDHVPAKQLGLASAWVNRRHDRAGSGATPAARPVEPDLVVNNMTELAEMLLGVNGPVKHR